MIYGLKEEIVESIINVLASFPDVEEVVLYGSRAIGNYKTGSDIDLTIKGNLLNNDTLNKISLKLDELYLPYTFDLSVFRYIDHPDLLDHINRAGKSLYQKHACTCQDQTD